jgi:hypothetical protein
VARSGPRAAPAAGGSSTRREASCSDEARRREDAKPRALTLEAGARLRPRGGHRPARRCEPCMSLPCVTLPQLHGNQNTNRLLRTIPAFSAILKKRDGNKFSPPKLGPRQSRALACKQGRGCHVRADGDAEACREHMARGDHTRRVAEAFHCASTRSLSAGILAARGAHVPEKPARAGENGPSR